MATAPYPTDHPIHRPRDRRHGTHPIHGILAAYPLALFTAAFATDIAYANTAEMQWANFSIWLIAGGLLGGVLAAIAGIVDAVANRNRDHPRRRRSSAHNLATIFMLAFALVNAFVHSRDAWTSVVPAGIIISGIVTVLALVTAWLGYSLEARQEDY